MFDQYYYHDGKKFMAGGTNFKNFYSYRPLFDYTNVSYKNDKGIANELIDLLCDHMQIVSRRIGLN